MVILPTEKQKAAMGIYANALQEIRGRLWLLNNLIGGDKGVNSHYTKEFCYLQLRMMCELIALGCLVAHGDIKKTDTKAFRKEASATKLMKMLTDLNSDFYPVPITMQKISPKQWDQKELKDGFLTKSDLGALYGRCGDSLHRSNLKKYMTNDIIIRKDFPIIQAWAAKITRLVDVHRIMLHDKSGVIFCKLIDFDHPERVYVVWAGHTEGEATEN